MSPPITMFIGGQPPPPPPGSWVGVWDHTADGAEVITPGPLRIQSVALKLTSTKFFTISATGVSPSIPPASIVGDITGVNSITWGASISNALLSFRHDAAVLSPTKVVVLCESPTINNQMDAQLLTITGSTITASPLQTSVYTTSANDFPLIAAGNAGQAVTLDSNTGRMHLLSVNLTTGSISEITNVFVESMNNIGRIVDAGGGKGIVTYRNVTTGQMYARAYDVSSGVSIVVGAPLLLSTGFGPNFDALYHWSATKSLYYDSQLNQFLILTRSGNTLTISATIPRTGAPTPLANATASLVKLNSGEGMLSYIKSTKLYSQVFEVDMTLNTVSNFQLPIQLRIPNILADGRMPDILPMDFDTVANVFSDDGIGEVTGMVLKRV